MVRVVGKASSLCIKSVRPVTLHFNFYSEPSILDSWDILARLFLEFLLFSSGVSFREIYLACSHWMGMFGATVSFPCGPSCPVPDASWCFQASLGTHASACKPAHHVPLEVPQVPFPFWGLSCSVSSVFLLVPTRKA